MSKKLLTTEDWDNLVNNELHGMTKQLASEVNYIEHVASKDILHLFINKIHKQLITNKTMQRLEWNIKKILKRSSITIDIHTNDRTVRKPSNET